MHKPSKCPTHLLHDSPIGEDLFTHGTDGPHQRTADAIAELILSEESKGQAIGLEGGWGSGKSNIIEILKKVFSVGRKDVSTCCVGLANAGVSDRCGGTTGQGNRERGHKKCSKVIHLSPLLNRRKTAFKQDNTIPVPRLKQIALQRGELGRRTHELLPMWCRGQRC